VNVERPPVGTYGRVRRQSSAGDQAGPQGPPAVEARSLTKRYGSFVAVDRIDFAVGEGECFGFLGPNGAGKTSTMKMIYGLATIDGGTLHVLGEDVARNRRSVKARLGVVPQEENLDRGFTVAENLTVHGNYFGIDRARAERKAKELLQFVQLAERGDDPIFALSGGMKRRLLIARSLINDPELVVLDEPTTGLDPQARIVVWGALSRLKSRGVTLLLTTHYMEEAERLCDRLVIMDQGRIVTEGKPAELIVQHVGREVLELILDERCPVDELLESLEGRFSSYDRTDGQVLLYGDDAEELLSAIDHERFPTEQAIVRHATLEDLFLRLTGRSLRE
jgi:lipooligosaccharide transport system ATP-binding protein